jgi:cytidylate kinase
MSTALVVAVDGPAGSGKSSVSKAVAKSLGFGYYDTGAAYRALAYQVVSSGVDASNENQVLRVFEAMNYSASEDPDNQFFDVDGFDVTELIRAESVSASVSLVAKHPLVRVAMVAHFRSILDNCQKRGIVMEGRDITTVVAPDAPVRILLTAAEDVRVARRAKELGQETSTPQVGESLSARDKSDQAVVDFMKAAPGVALLDSTSLTFEQTIQAMIVLINDNTGEHAS